MCTSSCALLPRVLSIGACPCIFSHMHCRWWYFHRHPYYREEVTGKRGREDHVEDGGGRSEKVYHPSHQHARMGLGPHGEEVMRRKMRQDSWRRITKGSCQIRGGIPLISALTMHGVRPDGTKRKISEQEKIRKKAAKGAGAFWTVPTMHNYCVQASVPRPRCTCIKGEPNPKESAMQSPGPK